MSKRKLLVLSPIVLGVLLAVIYSLAPPGSSVVILRALTRAA